MYKALILFTSICLTSLYSSTNAQSIEAVCQDITVELNENGVVSISAEEIGGETDFNGGEGTFSLSDDYFSCAKKGTHAVILYATDSEGNSSSCVAQITVVDNLAPEAECENRAISISPDGIAYLDPLTFLNLGNDNCSIYSVLLSQYEFTQEGVYDIDVTYVDTSGNTSACNTEITVLDLPQDTDSSTGNPSSGIDQVPVAFEFYPNPAENSVIITTDFESTFRLSVSDISGKNVILNKNLSGNSNIDLTELPSGVYIMKADLGSEIVTKKLIVK